MTRIGNEHNKLHTAAGEKNGLSTVISLLDSNPDKNYINQIHTIDKRKPVHFAAHSGSLETLQYLIQCGADLDSSHVNNDNLLYYAANNTEDVIQYITSPENNIIEQFNDGTTYFHAAIAAGRIEEVRTSLENNPNLVFMTNIKDDTPLGFAKDYGRHEIGKLIVQNLCDFHLKQDEDCEGIINEITDYARHLYENENLDQAFEVMNLLIERYEQIDQQDALKLSVKLYCDFIIMALRVNKFELAESNFSVASVYFSQMNAGTDLKREAKEFIDRTDRQLRLCLIARDRGYICRDVEEDGECFYHALLDQLILLNNSDYDEVDEANLRLLASQHISRNADIYKPFFRFRNNLDAEFKTYVSKITLQDSWADHLEILALSRELNMTFVILANDEKENLIIMQANSKATLYFGYLIGAHYQSLHFCDEIEPIKSIALEVDGAEMDNFEGVILSQSENLDEIEEMNLNVSAEKYLVNIHHESLSMGMHFTQFSSKKDGWGNRVPDEHVCKKVKLNPDTSVCINKR